MTDSDEYRVKTVPRMNIQTVVSVISLLSSLGLFTYTFGVQAQRIENLEERSREQQIAISKTPAILNELENINRRLIELKVTLENIPSRR